MVSPVQRERWKKWAMRIAYMKQEQLNEQDWKQVWAMLEKYPELYHAIRYNKKVKQ